MESGELAIAAVAFIGVCFFLLKYIVGVFNGADKGRNEKENIRSAASEEEKHTTATAHQQQQTVRKRVGGSNHSTRKSQTTNLQHPWLVSTLKGHEGSVLDLSYSSNGKYLVSSSQGDGVVSEFKEEIISSSSSGISSSSSNSSSPVSSTTSSPYLGRSKKKAATAATAGLSRRQKKNRKSKMASNTSYGANWSNIEIKSHEEMDAQLQSFMQLQRYVLGAYHMKLMGYPIKENGKVMIYKQEVSANKAAAVTAASESAKDAARSAAGAIATLSGAARPTAAQIHAAKIASEEADKAWSAARKATLAITLSEAKEAASMASKSAAMARSMSFIAEHSLSFDVYAREFVPSFNCPTNNAGESSGENDSDDSGFARTIVQKKCVRCGSKFRFDSENCEYLSKEKCVFHWGKLLKPWPQAPQSRYTCCNGEKGAEGCSTGRLHVWNGVVEGVNGPFDDFWTLKAASTAEQRKNPGVFAVDCEMCYTTGGLELARVTLVDHTGKLLIDQYVRPKHEIICYNTRFSGITAEHMKPFGPATTQTRVKYMLEKYMCQESILVGHGLDGDLRSLRLIHTRCVDTAFLFQHAKGFPMRRALRHLVSSHLRRNIQTGSEGHDSAEDAKATMELAFWYVKKNLVKCRNC